MLVQFPTRKARPPRSTGPVIALTNRHIRCTALYEPANGIPMRAILVPIKRVGAAWFLIDTDDNVIEVPSAADIEAIAQPAPAAQDGPDAAVTVNLPWPDPAQHALLLLLHPQLAGVGDTIRYLKARHEFGPGHPLAMAEADSGETGSNQAEPDSSMAAGPMIQQAVAAYLNEPGRNNQGILALPRFSGMIPAATSASDKASGRRVAPIAAVSRQATCVPNVITPTGIRFALASCQYPGGMIDGNFRRAEQQEPTDADIAPAERSLWRLARRFEQDPTLAFTVLAGDQIYVDATAGLFDARDLLDGLNFAYERVRDHQGMDRLARFGRGGIIALMDDHEVADNWEPLPRPQFSSGDKKEKMLPVARKEFIRQQRNFWWPQSPVPVSTTQLFETRTVDGFALFLADTRTARIGRNAANWRDAHIIDEIQRAALRRWIIAQASTHRPAFIASSSILLPRPLRVQCRPAMAQTVDSWCGYPSSLHAVLAWAFNANAHQLVFLSGDEHLGCLARVTVTSEIDPSRSVTLHSIHAGALYAPYPFANAIREDFVGQGAEADSFDFTHADQGGQPGRYHCSVTSHYPENGDGFTLVDLECADGKWSLTVSFEGENQVRQWKLPL